jgi:hypothetical protein
MDDTFIAITVIAFTKILVCYNIESPDGTLTVITYSEKMHNNFAKAMLRAMEIRDEYKSTHIEYRRWTLNRGVINNDDDAIEAIMASLEW